MTLSTGIGVGLTAAIGLGLNALDVQTWNLAYINIYISFSIL
jgi:hypothetical protein